MVSQPIVRPGQIVAWWDGAKLALGLVVAEDGRRVRLIVDRGREQRVARSRVALIVEGAATPPAETPEGRTLAGERIGALGRRLAELAAGVDVALVWSIVVEGGEAGGGAEIAELAELALESTDGASCAATMLALIDDGIHFVRRAERWVGRDAEAVEGLLRQRRVEATRAEQSRDLTARLRAAVAGDAWVSGDGQLEQRWLAALEQLAILDDAAPDATRSIAQGALAAAGQRYDRPAEGAFRLLRRLGRFDSDDQNLPLLRFGLRTDFSAEALAQARSGHDPDWADRGREDLRSLAAISIDGAGTREIDDLLSIEPCAGGWRLGVHIADPAAFFEPGDAIDREAESRAITHYMPDLRLTMLPPELGEIRASLIAGESRPALSFMIELDRTGELQRFDLVPGLVRSIAGLDYTGADRIIATGEGELSGPLGELAEFGLAREAARARAGALLIRGAEVDLHVEPAGDIVIERIDADSPSRRAVSEAMILAGEVAARYCIDEGLPAVYRRQAAVADLPELPPGGLSDPVGVRALRRRLRRAEVGPAPGPHFSLGLSAYTQVTSPLRRYQDLVLHRQIGSRLRGEPDPPYDAEAMQRIAATCERADIDARRAERAADDYWTLRYLEQRVGREVEATVVEVQPRPVVQLTETLWEQSMPALAGAEAGTVLRLRIERVNPRAGLVVLRRSS